VSLLRRLYRGEIHYDFIGHRRRWYTLSAIVVLISLASLLIRGFQLGIDFKGGTQITFRTPTATSLSKVRDEMGKIGRSDAVVQGRGASAGGDTYRSFQIRTKSLTPAQGQDLRLALASRLHATAYGSKNASSSFGRQIARLAIVAILVSLLLIVTYLSLIPI